MSSSVWNWVVGQDHAVTQLKQLANRQLHAFLFVGPEGCGKEEAARAFASVLLTGSDDSGSRVADLVRRGSFPDVHEVFREGAAVDKEEAEAIVRAASTTPTESALKIVVIHEVHLMRDSAAVRLLKTIEEPPERMVFILLADQLVPSLTTIASRCVTVTFSPISESDIAKSLIADGIKEASARSAASAAAGNIARARLLASDNRLAERLEAFAEVPYRLDGTGATVARLVDDLFAHLDTATEPLASQHERELVDLEARVALTGERGSGRKALQDRQKRQLRKARTDELRTGLAAIARSYHSIVTAQPPHPDADDYARAITKIHKAMGTLGLNANEELALQALLLQCPSLRMMARPSAVN